MKPDREKASEKFLCYLTPEEKEKITSMARQAGVSISYYGRFMIQKWLKKNYREPQKLE